LEIFEGSKGVGTVIIARKKALGYLLKDPTGAGPTPK
jgi:hypothetical protein